MNVRQIIKTYLEDNEYDGLCDGYKCWCEYKLRRCEDVNNCKPGYKHTDKDGNWYIDGRKE